MTEHKLCITLYTLTISRCVHPVCDLQERLNQQKLHVYEKATCASRINFRAVSMNQPLEVDDGGDEEVTKGDNLHETVCFKDDNQHTIAITRGQLTFPFHSSTLVLIAFFCYY